MPLSKAVRCAESKRFCRLRLRSVNGLFL